MPMTPVPIAAVSNRRAGDQPDLAANEALYLIATMNKTAKRPKIGPATSAGGSIWPRLMLTPDRSKIWAEPKKASLNHTDDTLAMAIGAIARIEKCLRTASCAKTIPAIGALNPAAMAPATPQPINMSVLSAPPVVCLRKLPIVAPKCTSGPYWPTDAPPLAEMKAARVDPKPDFTSSSLSLRCAA